ncbi:hypothetical protein [Sphingomonas sp.]|uniref:hypothetical protein n=1 Tax=Sphingomonas sp. TaxID=28214 RepID=UPI003CC646D5
MSEVVNLPRRRYGRAAPASLRPAPLSQPEVADLSRLLERLAPDHQRGGSDA